MKELKGTETEKNLLKAFQGESSARVKYEYFASKAKKDGYVQIANIFEESSKNEKEHAKLWFKYLNGGEIKPTTENLLDAAKGEAFEYTNMYKEMAEVAKKEGFTEIAEKFEGVAKIEAEHEKRFLKLLENINEGIVFSKVGDMIWKCTNCGHIHIGKEAPEVCPVCNHPKAYFEIASFNY